MDFYTLLGGPCEQYSYGDSIVTFSKQNQRLSYYKL